MNELDPAAKALFADARGALDPPEGAEERIFLKLGAAAGVSAATLATTTSAASQPAVTLLGKLSHVALWALPKGHALTIALVAFGGTVVAAEVHSHLRPAASHPVAATARVATMQAAPRHAAAPVASLVAPTTAVVTAQPSAVVAPIPLTVSKRVVSSAQRAPVPTADTAPLTTVSARSAAFAPEPPAAAPATPSRDTRPDAEISPIREMQAAWRSGQSSQLASAIAEHRSRFPQGMLSEEREALSAMLECRQSPARATDISAGFSARFPRSPYEARVDSACLTGHSEEK